MKILCLGNNTADTDVRTQKLAESNQNFCHGLISKLSNCWPETIQSGWYHSSVYDMEYSDLQDLAQQFDQVFMLDQPKSQYSHPDAFYKTVRLVKNLSNGKFIDNSYATAINFFENLVQTNKSFCIFPFIELLTNQRNDGYTTVCCRSSTPVTHVSQIVDWKNNKDYKVIRDQMIKGEPLPTHCSSCYSVESKNMLSARQQETVEWANRLNLSSIEDLESISHPAYYEIRPSNICNLQCRMCSPENSHLIGQEYKKLNLIQKLPTSERSDFTMINFDNLKKLYIAGGEPTAMPEFYEFLDRCIQQHRTDFEFLINTNGTKLSNRFKQQLKQFSNFQFVFSLDGLEDLNYYIRWPSKWNKIIENINYLKQHNHTITFNVTVSIFNVVRLWDLLKFFDSQYPGTLVHCQLCQSNSDMMSALIFPDAKLAVDRLLPIRQLKCYKNDPLLKSFIDSIIAHYQSLPDMQTEKLKLFFEFNDRLDQSRNVQLKDYVPELEQARDLLT